MFYRKNNISSEIDWLKDHTYSIQLHEFDDHSDLYFLKPLLQNKRIVFWERMATVWQSIARLKQR